MASYSPRPGSDTWRAIEYIQQRGSARSKEIEEAIGMMNCAASLTSAVSQGALLTCKVSAPNGQQQNEYRLATGYRLPDSTPPKKPKGWKAESIQKKPAAEPIKVPMFIDTPSSISSHDVALAQLNAHPYKFAIWCDGTMQLECGELKLRIPAEETTRLRRLLLRDTA